MLTFLSLRWRLTLWYFCTLAAILTFAAIGSWFAMRRSVEVALDRGLSYQLSGLRQYITNTGAVEAGELKSKLTPILGLSDLFRVYDASGNLICESTALTSHHVALASPSGVDSTVRYRSAGSRGFPLRMAYQRHALGGGAITVEVADPVRKFQTAIEEFTTILWFSVPILLLLATAGGFWLSTRALKPVDQLTEDARAITASGLSRRLAVPRAKDELRRLSETLNGMLDRIEGSFEQVRRFTADASHELRAPLTLIHTVAEFSLRRERSSEELRNGMEKIVREARRTTRLIEDLLLLARADSDPNAFPLHPIDVAPVLKEIASQAEGLAGSHGITVCAELADGALPVNADEPSLRRLLLVLVDNAIKYTPPGGHVKLVARIAGGDLLVSVSDTGCGIAEHDIPRIFERFWRADKVRSRESGGTGLGLSIAQEIAARHGSRILVTSEPGRGSTFTFSLPIASPL
jgi:heavy metal sensor kinase